MTLYGFAAAEARDLFDVQAVSGVGPKIALAKLAVLDPHDLRRALAAGDIAALTRVPGIGKRGAERMVLELRDKVGAVGPGSGRPGAGSRGPWRDQLVEALVGLGFTAKQAEEATDTVLADDPGATRRPRCAQRCRCWARSDERSREARRS